MPFAGKRVLALESRRAAETAELIRRSGGEPFVAPSMKEVPLDENQSARDFGRRVEAGDFDMVIFLTGVGTRYLIEVLSEHHSKDQIAGWLRTVTTVARGPKPSSALRELGVVPNILVPEPNTWREILQVLTDRPERRIAIQEYGRTGPELIEGLEARGASVTLVPVYRYAMPDDVTMLQEAVVRLAQESFEVVLFTSSQQMTHLIDIARDMSLEREVLQGLRKSMIASIGPTMSETLREHGIDPDLEPTHPKLGLLVKEAAERSAETLWAKKI